MTGRAARVVVVAVVLAAAVRVLGLPLWGTFDTEVQKAWAARAAAVGLADIYGASDRELLRERGLVRALLTEQPRTRFTWGSAEYFVDYPPGSLLVLWAAGEGYRLVRPDLPNKPLFNVAINLAPLLGSVAIALLLQRSAPLSLGVRRAAAFWLNPAVILAAPVLGYQDTVFGTAALGAVLALQGGRIPLAWGLVFVAGLLKPQGALLLPALGVVSWRELDLRGWARSLAAALVASAVVLAPWWTAGHLLSALDGCRRPLTQATLAPLGYNAWWIAGWLSDSLGRGELPLARILLTDDFARAAGFDPRPVSRALLLAATAFGAVWLWRAWPRDRALLPLAVVWQVHAYALVGTSVHENHTFLAVVLAPLLLGAWPHARALLVASSTFLFANLFLIAGLGRRITRQRVLEDIRQATVVDLSVLVAAGHVVLVAVLLVWMTRTLREPRPEAEVEATV
jgi:hypothetical protein